MGGRDILARWGAALEAMQSLLLGDALTMLPTLAACTGYSAEMLMTALGEGSLFNPRPLATALEFRPTWSNARRWERMSGLAGWARFFPQRATDRALAGLRGEVTALDGKTFVSYGQSMDGRIAKTDAGEEQATLLATAQVAA